MKVTHWAESPEVARARRASSRADALANGLNDYVTEQAYWLLVLAGVAGLLRLRAIRKRQDAARLWTAERVAAMAEAEDEWEPVPHAGGGVTAGFPENSSTAPEPPETTDVAGDVAAGD